MGACSSKPKTMESEGSMEPQKPSNSTPDQPLHAERGLDKLTDDHKEEAVIKPAQDGEASYANAEPVQKATGLDAGKDKQRSAELPHDVLEEKDPVCKAASDEALQKEGNGEGVSDAAVKKDDVNVIADNRGDNEGKEVSRANEAKTCEDKTVLSEETGGSQENATSADKNNAFDEEKSAEFPGKRNIIVPQGEAMGSSECTDVESPIIGVVKPAELMNETVDMDLTAMNGAVDPVKDYAPDSSNTDVRVVGETPGAGPENVELGRNKAGAMEKRESEPAGEAIAEKSAEIRPRIISVKPVRPTAETDYSKDSQEESMSQHQEAIPFEQLPAIDSNGKAADISIDPQSNSHHEERVSNHFGHLHMGMPRDEGIVDSLMVVEPKASETVNSNRSVTKSDCKDPAEESVNSTSEPGVEGIDTRSGQMQISSEKLNGYSRPGVVSEGAPSKESENGEIPAS